MFLAIDVGGPCHRHAVPGLLVAAGPGASVGGERRVRDRDAGSRTQLPLALGACLLTLSVRGVGRRR